MHCNLQKLLNPWKWVVQIRFTKIRGLLKRPCLKTFWVCVQVHAQAPDWSDFDIVKIWPICSLSMLSSHIYAKQCRLCSNNDWKKPLSLKLRSNSKSFISTAPCDQGLHWFLINIVLYVWMFTFSWKYVQLNNVHVLYKPLHCQASFMHAQYFIYYHIRFFILI